MELTPEERRKIYEEEKARIEAREQLERERKAPAGDISVDLTPNVAGLLCYLGWWITGLIFFIIEQKNEWVRFHAAQSIVVFGAITVTGSIVALIPWIGPPLSGIIWFIGFVLWIVLMIKAYQGERVRIAVAGDIAERMVGSSWPPSVVVKPEKPSAGDTPRAAEAKAEDPPVTGGATIADKAQDIEEKIERKVKEYFNRKQGLHIAGSAFAIAWSIILLVFFNFFHDYVAYYTADTVGNAIIWTRYPFLTSDISLWLPVLTTTLVAAIAGHLIIIVFYRPLLRRIVTFLLDCFGLATVLTLLAVFPFDFSVIPGETAASITTVSVTVALIGISVGIGISLVVRLVTTLVAIGRGAAHYQ
ncbi:MAG: hypothetical protein MUO19_08635 [Dehalococcoidales bacterium]|nr:hypothetical protein [Dehalococcoidales bacterium]